MKLYKGQKVLRDYLADNDKENMSESLLLGIEEACKALDLAEPVWVSKHTKDFSLFRRTKLLPSDFMEPVDFDFCTVEIL